MDGKIEKKELTDELRESYLDYAMSVIVGRALPDVRDGLKPVHRRILWAMWDSGLTHSAKLRKSANVVGEVLGRYHPHGDMAVYDSLARMAQNFSLRYPLIEGQGNWGCFTKDTEVKLVDGRSLPFEDLVKEYKEEKKNYTYTVNKLGLIAVAEIKNPRLTKKGARIIKVVLDNGEEIKCTPNHLFMLKDGTYKEAQDLTAKDSLMPLYQKLSEKTDRLNRKGYTLVYQPKKDEWVPSHHLADNFNLTAGKYSKNTGKVRHHLDFNKLNNNPDNIVRIQWKEHWQIHYQNAAELHKNPEYRQKLAEGRSRYLSDHKTKEKYAKILIERNIKNWQQPEYREKMRRFLSEVNKKFIQEHPEKRQEFSERATKTLKRLWQNPEYRSFMREKIIKGNKNHTTNKTGKLKFLNICKEILSGNFEVNKENYIKFRNELYPYGAATLWETGLNKYFQNNTNLIRQEINQNHRIVKIEKLSREEDVYDLTIEGTHNFCLAAGVFVHNSIDGDSPAAMRYTECRLSKIAEEMLFDIEKETVDFMPNYDGARMEPKVLPAKIPNLLINGSDGIAVGMATKIPPHNLTEVIDAAIHLIHHPKATSEDLMQFIQGPDFPTGGIIYNKKEIIEAYASGRGRIVARATAEIDERKIIITEIPYQVNKSELLIKIAELVQEKRLEGIKDVRDESDKDGLRIAIDLKTDAIAQKILNQLYNSTDLQKDYHLNLLALADGLKPRTMSIKDVLVDFIKHRETVVRRRAEFELKKAKERAHILEGLAKALAVIDKIIATIKKSADKEDAHKNLVKNFSLSVLQATAILEMKLQTLAALEQQKIEDELKEKIKLIAELTLLLKSPEKIYKVVSDEFKDIRERFGDERRTKVQISGVKDFKVEDLVPQEEIIITMSRDGYIKRLPPETFKTQRRGGKGLIGTDVGETDVLAHFMRAKTHDNILFFTDKGRVFQTKVYDIPAGSRTSKGKAIQNFLELPPGEKVSAVITYDSVKKANDGYLAMVTLKGVIKKTLLSDFANVRRNGLIAIKLKKEDELKWVKLSSGKDEMILTTKFGQAIHFKESVVRAMGRTASGVRAISLRKGDLVSSFDVIAVNKEANFLVVMANGYAKLTHLKDYKIQNRGGKGILTAKVTAKTGNVVSSHLITDEVELLAISERGQLLKTKLDSIRQTGRAAQGVRIMRLNAGDKIAGTVCL